MKNEFIRVSSLISFIICFAPVKMFAQSPPGAPPPQVTVAKPVMRTIVETQEFTGRFDAVQSVEIRSRVNGYLDKVNFIDGSLVKKDDLLFVVDKRTYQTALVQAYHSSSFKYLVNGPSILGKDTFY